jgi:hypothetical protein
MTDYENWSEQQINEAVALSAFTCDVDARFVDTPHGRRLKVNDATDRLPCANYCNDPSVAWPIIVRNEITLHMTKVRYSKDAKSKPTEGYVMASAGEFEDIYWSGLNPLMCAMIVYLMMQENDND